MKYQLNVAFKDDDVSNLNQNGYSVAIAKPTGDNTSNKVVWLAYKPIKYANITWEENYGIFESDTTLENNAVIITSTEKIPAEMGKYYSFNNNEFTLTDRTGKAGSFVIRNEQRDSKGKTFGLEQSAMIGTNLQANKPLCAEYVLHDFNYTATPLTKVYIWIQKTAKSGLVLESIDSDYFICEFGDTTSTISIVYDGVSNSFAPAPSPKNSDVNLGARFRLVKNIPLVKEM